MLTKITAEDDGSTKTTRLFHVPGEFYFLTQEIKNGKGITECTREMSISREHMKAIYDWLDDQQSS